MIVTKYLPQVSFTAQQVATRDTIVRAAITKAAQLQMVAADNSPLTITYGRDVIAAQIVQALSYLGRLVLLVRWGKAPIDAIEQVYFDNAPMPPSVVATHYLGASHSPNATMVAAWAAQRPFRVYSDAPTGTVYSVFSIPPAASAGFPQITAKIRGRKLYDDRTGLTTWSDNPALALADFARDVTGYGMGLSISSADVIAAANATDEIVGGEKRRLIGLTLSEPRDCEDWLQVLRTYAGCMLERAGTVLRLIPDRPVATSGTLSGASGEIVAIRRLTKRGLRQVPTVVRVQYTDTSTVPWSDRYAVAYAPGVLEGVTDYRSQDIPLPGVTRKAQATREATERLNKLRLQDLSLDVEVFDQALRYEIGDVIEITHPIGLTAKPMRLMGIGREHSRPILQMTEYDPSSYSDSVVSEPTWPDTGLDNPADPPTVPGLSVTEEVFPVIASGSSTPLTPAYASRFRVGWAAAQYAHVAHYRISVFDNSGAQLIFTGTSTTTDWVSPALQQGMSYVIKAWVVSTIGAQSATAATSAIIAAQGKLLPPGNVTSLVGFEVGGEVRLSWAAAVDIDVIRYSVRYGAPSVAWQNAIELDRVDRLRYETKAAPAGTFDFLVKAIDSGGRMSTTEARVSVVVTQDPNIIFGGEYQHTGQTIVNMVEYPKIDGAAQRTFVTASASVTVATQFPSVASTYTQPMMAYHPALASSYTTESDDFGSQFSGSWTTRNTASALTGSISRVLQLSTDNFTTKSDFGSMTAKTTARYARHVYSSTVNTDTLLVRIPESSTRVDALATKEAGGPVASVSSGLQVIPFSGKFSAIKGAPSIDPIGSASYTGIADRILVAPDTGLMYQSVVDSGSGAAYAYQTFYDYGAGSRTVLSDDYLQYDVFVVRTTDPAASGIGGVDMMFSDFSYLRTVGPVDQYGIVVHYWGATWLPIGMWYSRRIPLSSAAGKAIKTLIVVSESDTTGPHECLLRNVRITDSGSTVRASYYGTSGEPNANLPAFAYQRQTQVQMGTANSMLAYVFNQAGTRVAGVQFYWKIEGVTA